MGGRSKGRKDEFRKYSPEVGEKHRCAKGDDYIKLWTTRSTENSQPGNDSDELDIKYYQIAW